jgi:TPR repeat protein
VIRKRYEQDELDDLFTRADGQWEAGNLRSAFRLFLAAAKGGDPSSQTSLGYLYDRGIGVKPNRALALYWYRRAYRKGVSSAASNIGSLYREENKPKQALEWFERAIQLKDVQPNLYIAQIHLQRGDRTEAVRHLRKVLKAKPWEVFGGSHEEAQRILKRLSRPKKSVRRRGK